MVPIMIDAAAEYAKVSAKYSDKFVIIAGKQLDQLELKKGS